MVHLENGRGGGGGGRGENARVKELSPFLFSHPFFFLCEL